MKQSLRRLLAATIVVSLLVLPSAASANNYTGTHTVPVAGSPNHCDSSRVWRTDGGNWSVYWQDLGTPDPTTEFRIYQTIENRMSQVYAPHMPYTTHSSYQWTTDAVIHAGPYADWQWGAGTATGWCGKNWFALRGYVTCEHLATSGAAGRCDQHLVYFDHEDIDSNRAGAQAASSLACHELAHTQGLLHHMTPAQTCLATTNNPATRSTWLDNHSIDQHIFWIYWNGP